MMAVSQPALYGAIILLGLFLDLGVSVAAPRFYWNSSIPIFRRSLGKWWEFSFESLSGLKENNRGWTLRWIAAHDDAFRIAFRERLFGLSSFYTPIMHGELTTSGDEALLIGRLNWYPIGFAVVFAAMAIEFRAPDFIVALVVGSFLLFLLQRYRFARFASRCLEVTKRGEEQT
jgi:hypothetical protein